MSTVLSQVYALIADLFNFVLPWGLSFGAVIVGLFSAPLLVRVFKKFF